jgi:hypothetical protein
MGFKDEGFFQLQENPVSEIGMTEDEDEMTPTPSPSSSEADSESPSPSPISPSPDDEADQEEADIGGTERKQRSNGCPTLYSVSKSTSEI